jgi:hypothetical protein
MDDHQQTDLGHTQARKPHAHDKTFRMAEQVEYDMTCKKRGGC